MNEGRHRAAAWSLPLIAAAAIACRSQPPTSTSALACRSNADCSPSAYCRFPHGLCGRGPRTGSCLPRPAACHDAYDPVCACDSHVYATACDAHAAGLDLAVEGGCREGPPSWARCGAHYCDVRDRYCEIVLSDVLDPPTDYACKPLPATCRPADGGAPACACFPEGTRCLSFCGPIDTNGGRPGLHLTCRL